MSGPARVHSLLHVNLNVRDVVATGAFYQALLGLRVGMRTSGQPTSGESLGIHGQATTVAWFLYDRRGPRAAPALETLEWRSPGHLGETPREPHHSGVCSVGYQVPSFVELRAAADAQAAPLAELGDWPWRGRPTRLTRLADPDGIAVEFIENDALTQPQFSHLRLNVRDLTASVDWYGRIGLRPQAPPRRCEVAPKALGLAAKAALTVASLTTEADPSLSFELTAWDRPAVCGEPITPANHLGIYRIALGVDDVHAACAHLRRGDPEVPDPIWVDLPGTKLGGVCVLFLRDPDGITVELVQRPRAAMTGRS